MSQLDLSQTNTSRPIMGLVGYFQYNSEGDFNSPIWPYFFSDKNRSCDDAAMVNKKTSDSELTPELIAPKNAAFKIYQVLSNSKAIQQMNQS
jgi:two-component system phosphate regulon sensor histidine kinase PhoR